jgi:hypothetical protein
MPSVNSALIHAPSAAKPMPISIKQPLGMYSLVETVFSSDFVLTRDYPATYNDVGKFGRFEKTNGKAKGTE